MGRPKALLEYRGETFVGRLARVFAKFCDPVIVVLAHHSDAIRAGLDARIAINPDPDRGQLSSLQTGLAMAPADAEGFLFTPVDCPAVSEETVAELVRAFRERGPGTLFAIPKFGGRRGHPVCADASLIPEFLAMPPTAETRAVVNRHADRIAYVEVDDAGILADVDDPESYRALIG